VLFLFILKKKSFSSNPGRKGWNKRGREVKKEKKGKEEEIQF
jgi:hypothetical protein